MSPISEIIWSHAIEFRAGDAAERCVAVAVSKSNHYPFPRYSVSVGYRVHESYMSRTFSPRVEGQHVLSPVIDKSFEEVAALLQKAEEWIVTDAASESGTYVEERERRDTKAATGPGKPARTTGKTERDRAKRNGQGAPKT